MLAVFYIEIAVSAKSWVDIRLWEWVSRFTTLILMWVRVASRAMHHLKDTGSLGSGQRRREIG